MAGRDVALGDRHKARETRFGGEQVVTARVELALRDEITNREELAIRVEEEAELHRLGHGPRRRFQRRKALVQRLGNCGGLGHVPPVTIDRSLCRLRPEEHFDTVLVPAFAGQRLSNIDHGRGLMREVHQPCRKFLWQRMMHGRAPRPGHRARDQAPVLWRTGFAGRREVLEWRHVPGLTHRRCRRIVGRPQAGGRSTPGRHLQSRSDVQPDYRYPLRRRIADPVGEDLPCHTNCRNGRGSAGGRSSLRALLPSARRSRSFPPIRSRGR